MITRVRVICSMAFIALLLPIFFALWITCQILCLPFSNDVRREVYSMLSRHFRNINVYIFFTLPGIKVCYDGDWDRIKNIDENVFLILNHQSVIDTMVSFLLEAIQGNGFHVKYYMKTAMKNTPCLGYMFHCLGYYFVDRKRFDEPGMISNLEAFRPFKRTKWYVIYPEGSRYSPEHKSVIQNSREAAEKNGLQVLEHHLTPKYRGSWLITSNVRKSIQAVYDLTIVYESSMKEDGSRITAPGFLAFLKGECPTVYVHLRRIPIEDVPDTEEPFKQWLHELFVDKDRIVQDFYSSDAAVRREAWTKKPAKTYHSTIGLCHALVYVVLIPLAALTFHGRWLYTFFAISGTLIRFLI